MDLKLTIQGAIRASIRAYITAPNTAPVELTNWLSRPMLIEVIES